MVEGHPGCRAHTITHSPSSFLVPIREAAVAALSAREYAIQRAFRLPACRRSQNASRRSSPWQACTLGPPGDGRKGNPFSATTLANTEQSRTTSFGLRASLVVFRGYPNRGPPP